jgi:hypothetical protein
MPSWGTSTRAPSSKFVVAALLTKPAIAPLFDVTDGWPDTGSAPLLPGEKANASTSQAQREEVVVRFMELPEFS